MNHWTIGGLAAACAAVGIYLMAAKKEPPAPAKPPEPLAAVVPPPAPTPPAVLPEVVLTTDLDPLLDPPAKPEAGAPFDPAPPATPPANAVVPAFIPPAVDDDPVGAAAPMPRGVADPSRVVWYGEHRIPRQVGGGRSEAELWQDIIDSNQQRRFFHTNMVGVGFFF